MDSSVDAKPEIKEGVDYWVQCWEQGKTGWQLKEINAGLVANVDLLTSGPGAKSKKILVPLCGQTTDLLYLLSLGHQVFGIECAAECIQGLADRDGFNFIHNEKDSIYHTADGRLKIYIGDIFKFPIENFGPFDCVWDRGSLVALEYPLHKEYVDLMKRAFVKKTGETSNFRYLLESYEYDRALYPGPPRTLSAEDVVEHFGSWTTIKELSRTPFSETTMSHPVLSDLECYLTIYLLTSK